MAHALMVKMGFDKKERVKVKAEALRLILTNRIDDARQSILINFVNESMILTKEDEEQFSKIVYQEDRYMEVKEMITIYEEKGIEKGELIGDIRFTQLMKGLPISDKKELEKLSIDELKNTLKGLTKKGE